GLKCEMSAAAQPERRPQRAALGKPEQHRPRPRCAWSIIEKVDHLVARIGADLAVDAHPDCALDIVRRNDWRAVIMAALLLCFLVAPNGLLVVRVKKSEERRAVV